MQIPPEPLRGPRAAKRTPAPPHGSTAESEPDSREAAHSDSFLVRKWDQLVYNLNAIREQKKQRQLQQSAEKEKAQLEEPEVHLRPLGNAALRAERQTGVQPRRYDGYDSSRDLAALYSDEGHLHDPYRVDLEVANLRPAAEMVGLDTRLELAWGKNSKLQLWVNHDGDVRSNQVLGAELDEAVRVRHNDLFNRVQVAVDKDLLHSLGWKDRQPLTIRAAACAEGEDEACSELQGSSQEHAVPGKFFRWEGKTVYYAVTDRFANGDRSNDGAVDPKDPEKFHGGDWQGVIDKLDYLQSLNVDCIWLSPPYLNERNYDGIANRGAPPKDGFHGYWPMDFSQPDPNWGDMAKLRELTEQAHARGMKVMLDVVVNHTAYGHPWATDPKKENWFNHEGNISGLGQYEIEKGNLCYLPDLDQDNPEVEHYLIDVHKMWLQQGVDAYRVDAVRHVPQEFLRHFDTAMRETKPGYFAIGEVFRQDANYVAGYQNRTMDSMFDFPLAYAMRNVFGGDPSRTLSDRLGMFRTMLFAQPQEAFRALLKSHKSESMTALSEVFEQDGLYDNPGRLGTLIDNHDMIRFMSDSGGDLKKLEIALAFLYGVRGTPHVYYGTEVGMEGVGNANRNDMEWGKNPEFTDKVRALAQARHDSRALQFGKQVELQATDTTYAFSRVLPDEDVICVFNNGDEAATVEVKLSAQSPVPSRARLEDMLGGKPVRVSSDGELNVEVPAKGYRYLRWQKATG